MHAVTDNKDFSPPDQNLSPTKIVLLYALFGISLVLISNAVDAWLEKGLILFEHAGIIKGALFVAVTAGLTHLLMRRLYRQLNSSRDAIQLAEQKIQKLANYDSETGLPNTTLLLDRLNQLIAFNSRKRENTTVIYISLTGFKAVVDARGHCGGSEAMRCAASPNDWFLRFANTIPSPAFIKMNSQSYRVDQCRREI